MNRDLLFSASKKTYFFFADFLAAFFLGAAFFADFLAAFFLVAIFCEFNG
jgi:hypothetical protein